MALTAAQKTKVVQVLGYPAKVLDTGSVLYDKILSDRMENLTTETEGMAVDYLDAIAAIETQMGDAPTRFIAEQVGDIKLNTEEIGKLRKERKRLAIELGSFLDIPYKGSSSNIGVFV